MMSMRMTMEERSPIDSARMDISCKVVKSSHLENKYVHIRYPLGVYGKRITPMIHDHKKTRTF